MSKWRVEDSAELYNINGWGLKYFSINEKGHMRVTPKQTYTGVDLVEVMEELRQRNIRHYNILRRAVEHRCNRIELYRHSTVYKPGRRNRHGIVIHASTNERLF